MLQAGYSVTIPDGFFHFIPTNAKTFFFWESFQKIERSLETNLGVWMT